MVLSVVSLEVGGEAYLMSSLNLFTHWLCTNNFFQEEKKKMKCKKCHSLIKKFVGIPAQL